MKVTSEIKNYDQPSKSDVQVHSHWSNNRMVVIEFIGGEKRTVWAADLIAAIQNAKNTGGL
ncbi:hypothetical protein [Pantoea cypripedii]|uniref:Uncharacterized protein n=1 Tax=Pantoea cypripedii TaxID=55209 RepID=A0A6B9FZT7_PANCY|nr:hypothetical protein [Pantoea cypripedii]QGY29788.1 hypothetical protein CUN67_12960 [Pantoea cypripedii]